MSYVLNTEVPTQTIFLDSVNSNTIMAQDSLGRCYSDYAWFFSQNIICQPTHRMLVSVVDAQFPNVFPQIVTGYNDVFVCQIGLTLYTITLPSERYTIATLASYISANCPLTVTPDYITMKLTFTSSGSNFIIRNTTTCGHIIGMTRNMDGTFNSISSFANTLTMPNCFNLSGTPYVFLNIRNFLLGTIDSGNNDGVITRMDINAPFGNQCFFRPPTIEQHLVGTKQINSIRMYLTDHNGYALCLGSNNIQITLRIQFIQDPTLDENYISSHGLDIDTIVKQKLKPYPIPLENYHTDEKENEFGE